MRNTLKLAAAFALTLTGFCFNANAQGTKPVAKDAKMETKAEEKTETKKEEMKEEKMEAKGDKKMGYGKKTPATKMATKPKM